MSIDATTEAPRCDGWSLGVILRTVFDAYLDLQRGKAPEPTPITVYESYLRWRAGRDQTSARAFWARTVGDLRTSTPLPGERTAMDQESHGSSTARLDLSRLRSAIQAPPKSLRPLLTGSWRLFQSTLAELRDAGERGPRALRDRVLGQLRTAAAILGERSSAGTHRHGFTIVQLGRGVSDRLRVAAEAQRITLHTLLAGSWALVLSALSGERTVAFGTTLSGRDLDIPGLTDGVGLYIDCPPLCARVDPQEMFWEWLRELQITHATIREHQHLPIGEIHSLSGVPASEPLLRTALVFENYPLNEAQLGGAELKVTLRPGVGGPTHYSLVIGALPGEDLQVFSSYDRARFEPGSVDRIVDNLAGVLQAVAQHPQPQLASLLGEIR